MERSIQETNLQAIADVLREKEGSSGAIDALDFAPRILALSTGSGFAVPLTVTVDPGAQVTATHGETTVTGTSSADGTAILILTEPGTWTVTASLGEKQSISEIDIQETYYMNINFGRLPTGFTEIEYIQTSTACSINTNLYSEDITKITIDMAPDSSSGDSYAQYLFQAERNFGLWRLSTNKIKYLFGTTTSSEITCPLPAKRLMIEFDRTTKRIIIDGNSFSVNVYDVQSQLELFIGTRVNRSLPSKLYACKIFNGQDILRDYVPCLDESNNVGMFDLVTKKFYGNLKDGLTPGPAV